MATDDEPQPIALARTVRPQAFGRSSTTKIAEPIVEPAWSGIRVIAAAGSERAVIFDDGRELTDHPQLVGALRDATTSAPGGVIVDGYITRQIASEEPASEPDDDGLPSSGRLVARSLIGLRGDRSGNAAAVQERERQARTFAPGETVNLVVVDLLWLDGQWLLDIPLAERKRLLDSILPGADLVRAGMHVRPPLGTWVGSWRSQGFGGLTFKAANSRYQPGQRARDWASTSMPRR